MKDPVFSPENPTGIYHSARIRHLLNKPFCGESLGMFAWYYHRMLPDSSMGIYHFDSQRRMISYQSVPSSAVRNPQRLETVLREKDAAFVGLSLYVRRGDVPDVLDEILLCRCDLLCQQLHFPVLDMILLYRGGYIPLSHLKQKDVYLKDSISGWLQ